MKKKELKKRIKHLQQLTDCLISDNVRLMMRLGDLPCYEEVKERFNYNNVEIPKFGTCTQEDAKGTILERTKEPESKEQNDKRREIYEAQKPIGFPEIKTEGAESESELKENAISLEIRKKYLTRNGKEMTCWEKTSTGRYECTNEGDTFYYEKDGTFPGVSISWDIVSEVKE